MLTAVSMIGLMSSCTLLVIGAIVQAVIEPVVKIPDRISQRLLSWLALAIMFSAWGMGVGALVSSVSGRVI